MEEEQNDVGTDFEGRFDPDFRQLSTVQVNTFLKYKGLEFFGIYELAKNSDDVGGGWFFSKNILTKVEYVRQYYKYNRWAETKYAGAEFKGIVLEAAISF